MSELRHAYCGHEMLNEFNLINMNGRLYDPMTARFLSADNYVQLPDNSQSYNRYSYCLNNPLKYTDPSGEISYYKDNNGTYEGYIPEVVVTASEHLDDKLFNYASITNTIIDCLGTSLKENSGNSTYGNNNQFYWHQSGKCGFYGNQYVRTTKLENIGIKTAQITKRTGYILDGADFCVSAYNDYQDYQINGYTNYYHSVNSASTLICSWKGAEIGFFYGTKVGAGIGALFGGAGAVPGSILGGAIGGFFGAAFGNRFGSIVVNIIYEY